MRALITFSLFVFIFSCSNEPVNIESLNEPNIEIWNMFRQEGMSVNVWPNPGEVIWTFDLDTNVLTIENSNTEVFYQSGDYSFTKTFDALTIDFVSYERTFEIIYIQDQLWIFYQVPNTFDTGVLHGFYVQE